MSEKVKDWWERFRRSVPKEWRELVKIAKNLPPQAVADLMATEPENIVTVLKSSPLVLRKLIEAPSFIQDKLQGDLKVGIKRARAMLENDVSKKMLPPDLICEPDSTIFLGAASDFIEATMRWEKWLIAFRAAAEHDPEQRIENFISWENYRAAYRAAVEYDPRKSDLIRSLPNRLTLATLMTTPKLLDWLEQTSKIPVASRDFDTLASMVAWIRELMAEGGDIDRIVGLMVDLEDHYQQQVFQYRQNPLETGLFRTPLLY